MRVILVSLVFVLVMGAGILLAGSITWLRYGTPVHVTEEIAGPVLSVKEAKSKKWLKYNASKDYFYQSTVQYTYKRGTFPFLTVDTTVVDPKELWTRDHHNH